MNKIEFRLASSPTAESHAELGQSAVQARLNSDNVQFSIVYSSDKAQSNLV